MRLSGRRNAAGCFPCASHRGRWASNLWFNWFEKYGAPERDSNLRPLPAESHLNATSVLCARTLRSIRPSPNSTHPVATASIVNLSEAAPPQLGARQRFDAAVTRAAARSPSSSPGLAQSGLTAPWCALGNALAPSRLIATRRAVRERQTMRIRAQLVYPEPGLLVPAHPIPILVQPRVMLVATSQSAARIRHCAAVRPVSTRARGSQRDACWTRFQNRQQDRWSP